MAELTPQERLQPSLLDRLTDLAPAEREESREQRVINAARLREYVTSPRCSTAHAVGTLMSPTGSTTSATRC
jgi:hypothetical protein